MHAPDTRPNANKKQVFEFKSNSTAKVLVAGRAASLKIFPNKTSSSYLSLRFGRVEELDARGRPVYGHAVPSLAALKPSYSSGVRASGDADYTYVRLEFDGAALSLPGCPSEDKLRELGLLPSPEEEAAAAAAKGGARPEAAAGQQQQQRRQQQQQAGDEDDDAGANVKTLGDSRLAAAIAALTAAEPADKKDAAAAARRLRRLQGYAPVSRDAFDGRDPFEGLVTRPEAGGARGSVHVVQEPGGGAPAAAGGSSPRIAVTFFFGMSANKTVRAGGGGAADSVACWAAIGAFIYHSRQFPSSPHPWQSQIPLTRPTHSTHARMQLNARARTHSLPTARARA